MTAEQRRLAEERESWIAWGPYLSERQWGTVREDYSHDGNAWSHLTHDDARRRVYRWGEDAIGGFSDSEQRLGLAVAMWNGADPILEERLFGLTNAQGNHGEDARELYYYLDATTSHWYLKMLYKYPQAASPYEQLVNENDRRNKQVPEFELIDTGLFEENRYFDIIVEYAKASPNDILMRVTAINRGPDPARLVPRRQQGGGIVRLWDFELAAGEERSIHVRLKGPGASVTTFDDFGETFNRRTLVRPYPIGCAGVVGLLVNSALSN